MKDNVIKRGFQSFGDFGCVTTFIDLDDEVIHETPPQIIINELIDLGIVHNRIYIRMKSRLAGTHLEYLLLLITGLENCKLRGSRIFVEVDWDNHISAFVKRFGTIRRHPENLIRNLSFVLNSCFDSDRTFPQATMDRLIPEDVIRFDCDSKDINSRAKAMDMVFNLSNRGCKFKAVFTSKSGGFKLWLADTLTRMTDWSNLSKLVDIHYGLDMDKVDFILEEPIDE